MYVSNKKRLMSMVLIFVMIFSIIMPTNVKASDISIFSSETPTTVWDFEFKEDEKYQSFSMPYKGNYKLETWGAGNEENPGSYATGKIDLNKNENLFLYIGGQDTDYLNTDIFREIKTNILISSGGSNQPSYTKDLVDGVAYTGNTEFLSPQGESSIGNLGNGHIRISLLNQAPTIEAELQSNEIDRKSSTSITVEGSVLDTEYEEVLVKYYFDEKIEEIHELVSLTNDNYSFEKTINIEDLSLGVHELTLYAEDIFGVKSDTLVTHFELKENIPSIEFDSSVSELYNKNNVENLNGSLMVSDIDINDVVSIYYKLNSGGEVFIDEVSFVDEPKQIVEYSVPITYLSEEVPLHSVKFIARDKYFLEETIISTFSVVDNTKPKLIINDTFKNSDAEEFYNVNNEKTLKITGELTDEDINDEITVEVYIDEILVESQTHNKFVNSKATIDIDLDISGLEDGTYNLKVIAEDSFGNESDTKFTKKIIVKKGEAPTNLVINNNIDENTKNDILTYYNLNNTSSIENIEGLISDVDFNDKINIMYYFKGKEGTDTKDIKTGDYILETVESGEVFGIEDAKFLGNVDFSPLKNTVNGAYELRFYAIDSFNKTYELETGYEFNKADNTPIKLSLSNTFYDNYNFNNTPSILIQGKLTDEDKLDNIIVHFDFYKADKLTEVFKSYTKEITMPADDTGSLNFQYELPLDNLSSGFESEKYILNIYAEDSQKNTTEIIEKNFTVKSFEKPVISDVVINKTEFNLNNETRLTITGNIQDKDIGDVITYKYYFDNDEANTNVFSHNSNSPIDETSFVLDKELSKGLLTDWAHKISIYAEDKYGNKTAPISFDLTIIHNTKTIASITSVLKDSGTEFYNSNNEKSIDLSGHIKDVDNEDRIVINVLFDENETALVSKEFIAPIDEDFTINVPLSSLTEGTHTIKVQVVDTYGNETVEIFNNQLKVLVSENPYDLTIVDNFLDYYNLNNTKDIEVQGTVSDVDYNDTVDIMYYFTRNGEKVLLDDMLLDTFNTSDTMGVVNKAFNGSVDLTLLNDETDGTYKLHFYAIDSFDKTCELGTTYTFNKVNSVTSELTIINGFEALYNFNNTPTITIQGKVEDEDKSDKIDIYFDFYKADNLTEVFKTYVHSITMPADDTGFLNFEYVLSLDGLSTSYNPELYNLNIYVVDKYSNKSNEITNVFEVKKNERPVLEIINMDDIISFGNGFYNNNNIKSLTLNGNIFDEDLIDKITVKVLIDNEVKNSKIFNEILDNVVVNEGFSIDIPIGDLTEGTHNVEVHAVDKFNNKSENIYTKTIDISVGENPHDLIITGNFLDYYNLHNTKIIEVEGTVSDVDYDDTVNIMYYFTRNGEKVLLEDQLLAEIKTTENSGIIDKQFNGIVDLTLLEGKFDATYELLFYAVDKYNKKDILESTFVFNKVNNSIPALEITNIFEANYNSNNTPIITIEGNIVDEDINNNVDIYYGIKDLDLSETDNIIEEAILTSITIPDSSKTPQPFSVDFYITGLSVDFNKKNYKLVFYAKDGLTNVEGVYNISNTIETNAFTVKSNEKSLLTIDDKLVNSLNGFYNNNNIKKLTLDGTIFDEDLKDKITVQVLIDNEVKNSKTFNENLDNVIVDEGFSIDIPIGDLTEGIHEVKIYAIDKFNNKSDYVYTKTIKILVGENPYDLKLTNSFLNYYNLNNVKEILIEGSLSDVDYNDTIDVMYYFTKDGKKVLLEDQLLANMNTGENTGFENEMFNGKVDLTLLEDKADGDYELHFYATDKHNKQDILKNIPIFKKVNNVVPKLEIFNNFEDHYNFNNIKTIEINGNIVDEDIKDVFKVHYEFVDVNGNVKTSGILTPDIIKRTAIEGSTSDDIKFKTILPLDGLSTTLNKESYTLNFFVKDGLTAADGTENKSNIESFNNFKVKSNEVSKVIDIMIDDGDSNKAKHEFNLNNKTKLLVSGNIQDEDMLDEIIYKYYFDDKKDVIYDLGIKTIEPLEATAFTGTIELTKELLSEGEHNIYIYAEDKFGNKTTETSFILDIVHNTIPEFNINNEIDVPSYLNLSNNVEINIDAVVSDKDNSDNVRIIYSFTNKATGVKTGEFELYNKDIQVDEDSDLSTKDTFNFNKTIYLTKLESEIADEVVYLDEGNYIFNVYAIDSYNNRDDYQFSKEIKVEFDTDPILSDLSVDSTSHHLDENLIVSGKLKDVDNNDDNKIYYSFVDNNTGKVLVESTGDISDKNDDLYKFEVSIDLDKEALNTDGINPIKTFRLYVWSIDTLGKNKSNVLTKDITITFNTIQRIEEFEEDKIDDMMMMDVEDYNVSWKAANDRENDDLEYELSVVYYTGSYGFGQNELKRETIYTGPNTSYLFTPTYENETVNGKDVKLRFKVITIDYNKYGPLKSGARVSDEIDYEINIKPEITLAELDLDSKYNGGVFVGETLQRAELRFNVKDADGHELDYKVSAINDGKEVVLWEGTISGSTYNNKEIICDLDELINKNYTSTGYTDFKLVVNDNRPAGISDFVLDKTKDDKRIYLLHNEAPNMISFNMDFNDETENQIYDILMKTQTENDKPEFLWNADNHNALNNIDEKAFGDEIVRFRIEYSIDDGNTYHSLDELSKNLSGSVFNYNWLNNTPHDNTNVIFKLTATDTFGKEASLIYPSSNDSKVYLQKNNAPRKPLSLIITNASSSRIYRGNNYNFSWGISSEQDASDRIVKYTLGYYVGKLEDVNYNNITKMYEGTNIFYSNWVHNINKDGTIIFVVYATDKFGVNSEIQTFITTSLDNRPPNKTVLTAQKFSDVSSNTLSDKGFLKKEEIYSVAFENAGDPNKDAGDYVKQWDLQYQVANNVTELNEDNWTTLTTSVRNNITFNIDSFVLSGLESRVAFRIVAFDTSNLQTASEAVFFKCISDVKAPVWSNFGDVDKGLGYREGKTSNFKITDESDIDLVEIYSSERRIHTLYRKENNLKKSLDLDYVFTSNGTYSLRVSDIYGNKNEIIFNITGIDTTAPNLIILPEKSNGILTNSDYYLNINISDNDTGLKYIVIKDSLKTEEIKYEYNELTKNDTINYLVSANSEITASVYDNAGNSSSRNYTITNINKVKPIIVGDYDNKGYANRSVSIDISVDVLDNGQAPLGQWKVSSDKVNGYTFKTTNVTQTNATLTMTENCTITLKFVDIWGNVSDSKVINVSNILDGKIETNISYLITETDYIDYATKNDLPIDDLPIKIIDGINYVLWNVNNVSSYQVYAYIEIDERYTDRAVFDAKMNPPDNIYENGLALFYKFERNERKSFYIKDIFGNYSIVKVALVTYEESNPVKILEPIILDTAKTKDSVRVFFEVENGSFENNPDFYAYRDANDNIINIYDNFKWATLDENNNPVYSDEYKGKSFIYEFTENEDIRIWAYNEDSTDWTYRDILITNIDKIAPIIEIDIYEEENPVANEITITAKTNDSFVSREELIEYLSYNDSFSYDINNYQLSEDKKTATMTFTENMRTLEVFRFYAIDEVGNVSKSKDVFISNLYNPVLNIDFYYLNNKTTKWEPLTDEALSGLYTNKDIQVKAIATNSVFNIEDNLDTIIDEFKTTAIYTFTKNESYTFIATDEHGYKTEKTLTLADNINKEMPEINYIINKIEDVDTGYFIGANIYLYTNDKASIIYGDTTYGSNYVLEVNKNGEYTISASDVYGNDNSITITIDFIFKDIDKPEIIISDYKINPTNENIDINAVVVNGKFINVPEGATLDETETVISYSFEENGEIVLTAINYYGNENSLVERIISISNIDKISPNQPYFIESLDNNGQIVFNILDNGDDGLGIDFIKYDLKSKNLDGYSETRIVKSKRDVKLSNPESIINYEDGLYEVSLVAYDKAGNVSVPYISEVEIYNGQTYQFMETYNTAIEQINKSELTEPLKLFYLDVIESTENEKDTIMNENQRAYIGSKTTFLRNLIAETEFNQEELISIIDGYFARLEIDINDDSFMNELKVSINSVKSDTKKAQYIKKYEYYEELIKNNFIDKASEEFSYIDDLGNTINPLSGYVINENGETGYYDENGNFIKGKNEQLYYYTSNGRSIDGVIILDTQGKTYVDKLLNVVDTETGLVNSEFYYNKLGELITEPFIGGFYDFQGIWHNRGLSEPLPEEDEDDDEIPGEGDEDEDDDDGDGIPNDEDNDDDNDGIPDDEDDNDDDDDNNDKEDIPATAITLNKKNLELKVGDTYRLIASVQPSNTTNKGVKWTSEDTLIATVSNGVVKALKPGKILITAETINKIKTTCIITIKENVNNGGNSGNNDYTVVDGKPQYPSIDELFGEKEEEKIIVYPPNYTEDKLGKDSVAITQSTNLNKDNLKALYEKGHSTLFYNGFTTIKTSDIRGSKINIGIGNNKIKAIMSYKDINSLKNVDSFKLNASSNKTMLYINDKLDRDLSLGKNSKLILFNDFSEDYKITLDGYTIKADYDKELKGYVVNNPKSGTYVISEKTKELSQYKNISKYNFIDENIYKENLTYRNIYIMAYNALNLDSLDELYSNIDKNVDIYREISILQRQGIVGKDVSNIEKNITGKEAYDIIYLTLSNIVEDTLNYNIKDFSKLETVTLKDMDNIIQNILNK